MDATTRLLTRWFAIAVGAFFSWTMIDLVYRGRLKYYLADQKFELLVLIGGVLLGLVVLLRLRGILLAGPGGDHHHDHGHDHAHDHADEPAHEHGVSLWRFIVLAVPLMVVGMGLAPAGLSADAALNRMTRAQKEAIAAVGNANLPAGRKPDGRVIETNARELQEAASQPALREYWESQDEPRRARLAGQVLIDPRFADRYRLTRFRITCCAADASPMVVTVIGAPREGWKDRDWVEVTGPVGFIPVTDSQTGQTQYFPVIYQQIAELCPPKEYLQ